MIGRKKIIYTRAIHDDLLDLPWNGEAVQGYFLIVYFGFCFLNSIAFSRRLSIPEMFSYNEITSLKPL